MPNTNIKKLLLPGATGKLNHVDYNTKKHKKVIENALERQEEILSRRNLDWEKLNNFRFGPQPYRRKESLSERCLKNLDILPFAPIALATVTSVIHTLQNEPSPVLHGLQDGAFYYAGALLSCSYDIMIKPKPFEQRNKLRNFFIGTACLLTSAVFMSAGVDKKADQEKHPTDQKISLQQVAPQPKM